MDKDLRKILVESEKEYKANELYLKRLKKKQKRELDQKFHEHHDKAFQKIDCLDCANCCKTTSPIFTIQDIKRLSKLFKMKQTGFISTYLKLDEDDDYVLQNSPCPFLQDDHTCFVYDVRPQACKEYPHTNRKNMYQILTLTKKNSLICPAVAEIVKNMKDNS